MSRTIWTQCGGKSNGRPFTATPWRVVEAQHVIATMKLVDSLDEQDCLERLIDTAKHPAPSEPSFARLDYLLSTPFRHPPLKYGSRFGVRGERGMWYGSDALPTAFAETSYYKLLFLAGTTADIAPITLQLSAFRAPIRAERGVDLTVSPFAVYEPQISSPVDYEAAHALGTAMRADGIEAFRFRSARDPEQGTNIGLFEPVFASKTVKTPETWICRVHQDRVDFQPNIASKRKKYEFPRSAFEVAGRLPMPSVA